MRLDVFVLATILALQPPTQDKDGDEHESVAGKMDAEGDKVARSIALEKDLRAYFFLSDLIKGTKSEELRTYRQHSRRPRR